MIVIIDYGLGNINAFANIYKSLNIPVKIAKSSNDFTDASKLILPGVGSFDSAMQSLERSAMRGSIDELVLSKKIPVLGICVGMQILALSSEEGHCAGLGWIKGRVKKFNRAEMGMSYPLPHMGWNTVKAGKDSGLFKDYEADERFYFLHSYYLECGVRDNILGTTGYGTEFCCVVNSSNIYGVQFHPEKSHRSGIKLLKNFAEL